MTDLEIKEKLAEVICRAWIDPNFCEILTSDPHTVLSDVGITLGQGVNVTFHVDSPTEKHFVIPSVPDLSDVDAELRRLVAEHASYPCSL